MTEPAGRRRRGALLVRLSAGLHFAGLALHGPRNAVDKIFKGANLHP